VRGEAVIRQLDASCSACTARIQQLATSANCATNAFQLEEVSRDGVRYEKDRTELRERQSKVRAELRQIVAQRKTCFENLTSLQLKTDHLHERNAETRRKTQSRKFARECVGN
ncbi:MAG: hypothetical protein ACR2QS_02340, partial [Woeseiaceae bacterium]